jgi:hypothetical protein
MWSIEPLAVDAMMMTTKLAEPLLSALDGRMRTEGPYSANRSAASTSLQTTTRRCVDAQPCLSQVIRLANKINKIMRFSGQTTSAAYRTIKVPRPSVLHLEDLIALPPARSSPSDELHVVTACRMRPPQSLASVFAGPVLQVNDISLRTAGLTFNLPGCEQFLR